MGFDPLLQFVHESDCLDAFERSVELREGGDAGDWLFMAMANEHLGNHEAAIEWYRRSVEWLEGQDDPGADLELWRAEAAELLGAPP